MSRRWTEASHSPSLAVIWANWRFFLMPCWCFEHSQSHRVSLHVDARGCFQWLHRGHCIFDGGAARGLGREAPPPSPISRMTSPSRTMTLKRATNNGSARPRNLKSMFSTTTRETTHSSRAPASSRPPCRTRGGHRHAWAPSPCRKVRTARRSRTSPPTPSAAAPTGATAAGMPHLTRDITAVSHPTCPPLGPIDSLTHPSPQPTHVNPAEEARVRAIADVVRTMIDAVRDGKVINLNSTKNEAARRYGLKRSPKLVELIGAVPDEHRDALLPQLRAKPVRTASGIAVVAVMSKPHRCPHIATTGNICVYCPGGPDSDFEYSTQSYTGYEPTSMRAIRARYDPYVQARGRVDQLRRLGHSVDKVGLFLFNYLYFYVRTGNWTESCV